MKFDQTSEYKRSAWAYPLRDFHEICSVYTPFQDALDGQNVDGFVQGLTELWRS